MIKKTIKLLLGISLTLTLASSFSSLFKDNAKGVLACSESDQDGPVFYAASYSDDLEDEPYYSDQYDWTFEPMNFKNTSSQYRGDSVKVAIIDSGINYSHEDFGTIEDNSRSIEYDSGWYYYDYSTHPSHLNDTFGHGTNVASVVASQINGLGVGGISPNVELYVYKVTDSSNNYQWIAIQNALQYCIDFGIDVINMSFQAYENPVSYGGNSMPASSGCSTVLTSSINACYEAGITMVAAAGNFNTSELSYPASNNHVISVGSLAKSEKTTKAGYSNFGDIDLVAPGTVYVANNSGTSSYKETSGTSFSAPIVTAAIALYKEKHPSATCAEIEDALYASCDSFTSETWQGHGRLNIDNFLGTTTIPTGMEWTNVNNDELALETGDVFKLEYEFVPSWTTLNDIEFSLYNDDGVLSVSSDGTITALKPGEEMVFAESHSHPEVNQCLTVTVTDPVISVTGVQLDKHSSSLSVNETSTLTATVSPSNAEDKSVTWSSSDNNVASVNNGTITAKKKGSAVITVTTNDGGFTDTCSVTVTAPLLPDVYTKVTDLAYVQVGAKCVIVASGYNYAMSTTQNNNNRGQAAVTKNENTVSWTSSVQEFEIEAGTKDGTYAFKTDEGYIYAASSSNNYLKTSSIKTENSSFKVELSGTNTVLTAQGTSSNNIIKYNNSSSIFSCYSSGSNPVSLYVKSYKELPHVNSLELDKSSATLDLKQGEVSTCTLTPTVTAEVGADTTVYYESSDSTVASVSKSSGTSTETITVTGLKVGECTITATCGNKEATCSISVIDTTPVPVTSVSFDPSSITIGLSGTQTLSPNLLPANATNKNLSWSSSNSSIVSVDQTGKITANTVGEVTITATSTDGSNKSGSCVVTVTEAIVLTKIEISSIANSAIYKSTYSITGIVVTATYSDSHTANVTSQSTITNNVDTDVLGTQYVNASYTEDNITKETSFAVNVTNNGAEKPAPSTLTYIFTDKNWSTSENKWTNGKSGNGHTSGQGVQVTTGSTGAYTTSKDTFSNVSSITVRYCTNASSGKGSISVQVGSGTSKSFSISKPSSGGTTLKDATFEFNPNETGTIKLTGNCTTNSIYIYSISITYGASSEWVENQAKAWATYFLSQTNGLCNNNPSQSDIEGLKGVWTNLSNEYGYMESDSKTSFVNSSDSIIVEARERYTHAIRNHNELSNFVTDGQSNTLLSSTSVNSLQIGNNSVIFIILISVISITVIGGYLYLRRKEH